MHTKGDKDLSKRLTGIEKQGASTEKSMGRLSGTITDVGDASRKSDADFKAMSGGLDTLGKSSKGASGGLSELAAGIKDVRTVSATVAGIPALIAAIGAVPGVATAAAGAVGQLGLALGQGLAGGAAIGGTALGGAVVGLKAYTAAITSTVTASRESFEATHENLQEQIALQRQTILNTQASKDFNHQLNANILTLSVMQAEIGNEVFPKFTREMNAWGEIFADLTPEIARTSGAIAEITAGFSRFVRTEQDGRLLADVFSFINASAEKAAWAISAFAAGGLRLFQQMIGPATLLQDQVLGIAQAFFTWTASEKNMQRMSSVIGLLQQRMYALIGIALNLGRGLTGVFQALNFDGGPQKILFGLQLLANSFAEIMEKGKGGRLAIINFMRAAQPTLNQLWQLTKTVVTQFGLLASNVVKAGQAGGKMGTLATVIKGIRESIVPLRKLFQDTFVALGPVLSRLIPEVSRFMQTFLGSSGPLIGFLNSVERLLSAFNRLPPGVRNAIASFVALRAIMGALGITGVIGAMSSMGLELMQTSAIASAAGTRFGILGVALAKLRTLFATTAAFLMGPWGIAIAAVATAGVLIYRNWNRIGPALKPAIDGFRTLYNFVRPFAAQLGGAVVKALRAFASGLLSAIAPGKNLGAQVKGLATALGNFARRAIPVVIQAVKGMTAGIKAATPALRVIGQIIGKMVVASFKAFGVAVRGAIAVIKALVNATRTAVNNIKQAWTNAKNNTVQIWNAIKKAIDSAWNAIKKATTTALNAVKKAVTAAWNAIKKATTTAWDAVKKAITERITQAKESVGKVVNELKSNLSNAWDNIKSRASEAWNAVKDAVVNPMSEAKDKVVSLWNELEGFVNGVLSRLGIGGGGSGGSDSGGGSSGGNPGSAPTPTGTIPGRAKGGKVRARPGGVYQVAEGGQDEWVINPSRPDNVNYLKSAADEMGYSLMRKSGAGERPHRHPHISGRGEGLGATHYNVTPDVKAEAQKIASAVGGTWNTYAGHGEPGGSVESRTVDIWGPGGRGSPIGKSGGFKAADMALASGGPPLLYMIRQGEYWRGGAWKGWPQDPHYDHTHISYTPNGQAAGGGSFSMPNPLQALFERLWKPIQAFADKVTGPLMDASFVMSQAGGKLADNAVTAVYNWIDEKIPDTIGGSSAPYSGGGELDQWLSDGLQAGGAFPNTSSNVAKLHSLAMEESGGDPNAVNEGYTAGGGHPSGLLQMLPDTFKAHMVSGMGDIFNPVHNTASSTRYQKSRYGYLKSHAPYAKGGITDDGVKVDMPNPVKAAFLKVADTLASFAGYGPAVGIKDGDRGGVGTGKHLIGITNEAGPEAIVPLRSQTPEGREALRVANKAYGIAAYAQGGFSFHGPLGGVAADITRKLWDVPADTGSGGKRVWAGFKMGVGAGRAMIGGSSLSIDPRFQGTPVLPKLVAHEVGHTGGLDHNWPTPALMSNPVGVNSTTIASERAALQKNVQGKGPVNVGKDGGGGGGSGTGGGSSAGGGFSGGMNYHPGSLGDISQSGSGNFVFSQRNSNLSSSGGGIARGPSGSVRTPVPAGGVANTNITMDLSEISGRLDSLERAVRANGTVEIGDKSIGKQAGANLETAKGYVGSNHGGAAIKRQVDRLQRQSANMGSG